MKPPLLSVLRAGVLAVFPACGGSSFSIPPPPAADFTIGVSPSSVSTQVGGTSSWVTVTVTAQNGVAGRVSVMFNVVLYALDESPAISHS